MTESRVQVSISRHGLRADKPMDGRLISWEIGERVRVTSGQDEGRIFVITGPRMFHPALTGSEPYVREGYFEGDQTKFVWAKAEQYFWFPMGDEPGGA